MCNVFLKFTIDVAVYRLFLRILQASVFFIDISELLLLKTFCVTAIIIDLTLS